MKRLFLSLMLLGSALPAGATEVLTTIKPIGFIAAAITRDISTPEVLLPSGASPHDFALRPSDIRRIESADLVVWVGPDLEQFMVKPLSGKSNTLTLLDIPGLPLHRFSEEEAHEHEHDHNAGAHEEDGHDHDDGDHDEHDHDHHAGGIDPHIWLGPNLAVPIAKAIVERLSAIDPANQARYQANLARFEQELALKDKQVASMMEPVKKQGYFVFHEAYGYWERHYGMQAKGHFTVSPERRPGAKTLVAIRKALEEQQARCVFAEPQFKPDVIESVARNTGAKVLIQDETGGDLAVGPDAYIQWMDNMAKGFAACQ
ncbi:MAG: zinc ABC transporter substrate-binding protein ZnuA [Aeromonas sp.]